MRKIELELESLKNRLSAAEKEITKLKSENQNLRIDQERILNQFEQFKNFPSLSVENVLKLSSIQKNIDLNKTVSSNFNILMENPAIAVSAKFGKKAEGEEDAFCFDYKEQKIHESNFNCESLCFKTVDNTNLNAPTHKSENEEEEKPVFKTLTGDKYHNENCKHLERSRIKINLSDARKRKMKPCKVCAPDLF